MCPVLRNIPDFINIYHGESVSSYSKGKRVELKYLLQEHVPDPNPLPQKFLKKILISQACKELQIGSTFASYVESSVTQFSFFPDLSSSSVSDSSYC